MAIEKTREMEIREAVYEIINLFEDLLEWKSISIPCMDCDEEAERMKDDNSARIYGSEYWLLEKNITTILKDYM